MAPRPLLITKSQASGLSPKVSHFPLPLCFSLASISVCIGIRPHCLKFSVAMRDAILHQTQV